MSDKIEVVGEHTILDTTDPLHPKTVPVPLCRLSDHEAAMVEKDKEIERLNKVVDAMEASIGELIDKNEKLEARNG